jgi:hypothetical protein
MSSDMKSRRVDPDLLYNSDLIELEKRCDRHQWGALRLLLIGIWMYADANGQFEWDPKRMRHHITSRDMHKTRFTKLLNVLLEHDYIHRYNEDGERDEEGRFCHVRTWHWQVRSVGKFEAAKIAIDCPCENRKQQGEHKAPRTGQRRERKVTDEPLPENFGKYRDCSEDCENCHGDGFTVVGKIGIPCPKAVYHDDAEHEAWLESERLRWNAKRARL